MLFSFAFFAGVMALLLQPALPAQWVWGGVAVLALGGPAVFVTRLRALGFVLCELRWVGCLPENTPRNTWTLAGLQSWRESESLRR